LDDLRKIKDVSSNQKPGQNLTRDQEDVIKRVKRFLEEDRQSTPNLLYELKRSDRGGKGYLRIDDIAACFKDIGYKMNSKDSDNLCNSVRAGQNG
jgi:hypothetical protein